MSQIEDLLRQTIGLHASTIGTAIVEQTVRSRMKLYGLAALEEYEAKLRLNAAEWEALIEALVVTETWFFRDRGPFSALVKVVFEEWLPANPAGVLRLLSLPCASGEEPLSMAMALLDAGIPPERFRIDAVDISARALAHAQRGIYGKNSFRSSDLGFRRRHFQPVSGGFSLNPDVRRKVWFQRGNILDEKCLADSGSYDIIFCRNLLIYFDRPTQERTLKRLQRLLVPTGVLFLGSAEVTQAMGLGFTPLNHPSSFACRNPATTGGATQALTWWSRNGLRRRSTSKLVRRTTLASSSAMQKTRSSPIAGPRTAELLCLEQARLLADAGRWSESAAICEAYLKAQGASAEAYYLLGRVQDAAGADGQAGEYYRRALYLEPGHCDAMRQWALLAERNGNAAQARILRARAGRRAAA
jgi:chemotaxis protein methyltransferase WspC